MENKSFLGKFGSWTDFIKKIKLKSSDQTISEETVTIEKSFSINIETIEEISEPEQNIENETVYLETDIKIGDNNIIISPPDFSFNLNERANNVCNNNSFETSLIDNKDNIIASAIINYKNYSVEGYFFNKLNTLDGEYIRDDCNDFQDADVILAFANYLYHIFSVQKLNEINKQISIHENFVTEHFSQINIKIDSFNLFAVKDNDYLFLFLSQNINQIMVWHLLENLINNFFDGAEV